MARSFTAKATPMDVSAKFWSIGADPMRGFTSGSSPREEMRSAANAMSVVPAAAAAALRAE